MILFALLLATSAAVESSATAVPVHLRNRDAVPGAPVRGPRTGRLIAKPMGAPPVTAATDRFYAWTCPSSHDEMRVLLTRFGTRADSNQNIVRLLITSKRDPVGIEYRANATTHEGVEPDTTLMCTDLNGDGEPDIVVRRTLRELPSTGQYIEVVGTHRGKVRRWIGRENGRIPKDIVRLKSSDDILVWVTEPHGENFPYRRADPPMRDRLLLLRDTTWVDVSAAHPEWFAPTLKVSEMMCQMRAAMKKFDVDWAVNLLQHTWGLMEIGKSEEAKEYFEDRFRRAGTMEPELHQYLEAERKLLKKEWSGK